MWNKSWKQTNIRPDWKHTSTFIFVPFRVFFSSLFFFLVNSKCWGQECQKNESPPTKKFLTKPQKWDERRQKRRFNFKFYFKIEFLFCFIKTIFSCQFDCTASIHYLIDQSVIQKLLAIMMIDSNEHYYLNIRSLESFGL